MTALGVLSGVYGAVGILLVAGAVCLPAEATAQAVPGAVQADMGEPIAREWALRGVIISDAGQSAVLEHLPSGRQELLALGAAVTAGVSVVTIHADRVVLGTEGGATVALRLSHDGHGAIGRQPKPAARAAPPLIGRRRAR